MFVFWRSKLTLGHQRRGAPCALCNCHTMLAKMVKLEIKSCPLNGAIVQRFNKPVSEGCCMRSPPSVIEASCNSQTNAHLSSTSWVEDAADCVESPCRSRVGSDALDLTPPALGAACSYYVAGWSDQHTPRATRADAPPQKSEVPLLSLFPSLPPSCPLSRALLLCKHVHMQIQTMQTTFMHTYRRRYTTIYRPGKMSPMKPPAGARMATLKTFL